MDPLDELVQTSEDSGDGQPPPGSPKASWRVPRYLFASETDFRCPDDVIHIPDQMLSMERIRSLFVGDMQQELLEFAEAKSVILLHVNKRHESYNEAIANICINPPPVLLLDSLHISFALRIKFPDSTERDIALDISQLSTTDVLELVPETNDKIVAVTNRAEDLISVDLWMFADNLAVCKDLTRTHIHVGKYSRKLKLRMRNKAAEAWYEEIPTISVMRSSNLLPPEPEAPIDPDAIRTTPPSSPGRRDERAKIIGDFRIVFDESVHEVEMQEQEHAHAHLRQQACKRTMAFKKNYKAGPLIGRYYQEEMFHVYLARKMYGSCICEILPVPLADENQYRNSLTWASKAKEERAKTKKIKDEYIMSQMAICEDNGRIYRKVTIGNIRLTVPMRYVTRQVSRVLRERERTKSSARMQMPVYAREVAGPSVDKQDGRCVYCLSLMRPPARSGENA